ncbi:uncharacterized protein LOC106092681 [Stomoxys calcitrans]|uniref:uncharacterized protein LOC106092681 n=1 Tax=Stomoxys calcitrans TaxID=35570 RepID=UPI0027E2824D|nr:uncharacterized protein LOC106092681 [Stomoxys calcitrans]
MIWATILLECLIILSTCQKVKPDIDIKWFNCSTDNKAFSRFEVCSLNSYRKNQQSFSYYVKMMKTVTHCDTRVEVIYLSAPKPFTLANISFDACELLKGRKRFVAARRLFDIIGKYTNFNHTCPYAHDVFATNITLVTDKLPFPTPHGTYSVKISFYVNGRTNTIVLGLGGRIF